MFNVTRTVYNMALETAKMLNTPYVPLANTTLNEKYNRVINSNDTDIAYLKYYGLGLNYQYKKDDKTIKVSSSKHRPYDIDVYKPIPFLVREKRIGLSSAEVALYSMRVLQTIDDVEYICCYLKKIDNIATNSDIYIITKNSDGKLVPEPLNTGSLLFTQPIPADTVCDLDNNYRFCGHSQMINLILSDAEVENIKEGINILYKDEPDEIKDSIGEFCLYTGIESIYNGERELSKVQAGFFKAVDITISDIDDMFKYTINIGGTGALYVYR
jgi:hypothetical protein